jgi:type II secretory pathway pseudopilin PulG
VYGIAWLSQLEPKSKGPLSHSKKGRDLSKSAKTDMPEMRYLLEDLSDEEKVRMEDTFFADDSKFVDMELAEEELIDAYVRNELSSQEQLQFKAKLMRSRRLRERVNFASALIEKADSIVLPEAEASREREHSFSSPAAPIKTTWLRSFFAERPAWGMAMATCAVLILVGGLLLVPGWLRLRKESEQLRAERAALQQRKEELDKRASQQGTDTQQLTAELQREREQRAADLKLIAELQQTREFKEKPTGQPVLTAIATVFLTPGSLRSSGGGQSDLIIGSKTTAARVQLALEKNDYPSYSATLKTADRAVVFRKDGLKPRNNRSVSQLLLYIPFRLNPGDYIITASGRSPSGRYEDVGDYTLHVTTK